MITPVIKSLDGMVNGPHPGALYPAEKIERKRPSSIGLAVLRRDGFVSLDADTEGGYLLTKPILLDTRPLHLNVTVRTGGRAGVIVCDPWASLEDLDATSQSDIAAYGQPGHNDYNHDDDGHVVTSVSSEPISGDHTDVTVSWPDGALKLLIGKACTLRIELANARLYSYWFE